MSTRAVTFLLCAILAWSAVGVRSVLFAQVGQEAAPAAQTDPPVPPAQAVPPAHAGKQPPRRDGGDRNDPRWQSLTEEQKKEYRKKYERFKRLRPEEREELYRRHEELGRLRERIVEKLEAELKDLSPEERKRAIDRRVRKELENIRTRIKNKEFHQKPPPPGSERWDSNRRMRKGIERENIRLAECRLSQMVKEGLITTEEKSRIQKMPHEEKIAWILDRQKKDSLRYLEGSSTPEEIERFRRMSRHRFHDEMRRQRKERGLMGGFARFCKLTPEQDAVLKKIVDKRERGERKRAFFDENFRSRLESLEIEKTSIDGILALPMPLRIRKLGRLLREIPPDKIPLDLRPLLAPPPPPRQSPPRRPGPSDGPGPGKHRRGDRGPPDDRRQGDRRQGDRRQGDHRPGDRGPDGSEPGRAIPGKGKESFSL
jgi:hypothetical protein